MTEPKSEATDGNNNKRKPNIVVIQPGDGISIAELEQLWNSLKPDDTTSDVPSSTLTVDQWISFTQKYTPKRIFDPRRARLM
jgi:hypothetical protein